MIALIWFCLTLFVSPFKSKFRLEVDNALLRQQLAMLDTTRRVATVILTTSYGTAWTDHRFRASWGKACAKAGILGDLTFHDLRGSAVTRLAEAGCEVPEIAAITGHSLADVEAILGAHYLGQTTKLALSGMAGVRVGR